MLYTAYFGLAVNAANPKLPAPGLDGVVRNVSKAIIIDEKGRGIEIPIHAAICETREEFVSRVSVQAGKLYDAMQSVFGKETNYAQR
jgi:hypothetical protein